jgi:hypothetical protein
LEILAATRRWTGDLAGGVTDAEQRGVDPAGTELRAENFAMGVDWETVTVSTEVDFPTLRSEDITRGLPFVGESWQQPKADSFVRIVRLDGEAESGF